MRCGIQVQRASNQLRKFDVAGQMDIGGGDTMKREEEKEFKKGRDGNK